MDVSIETTEIPGVMVVGHQVIEDERGFFLEVFRQDEFAKYGLPTAFVQMNQSKSSRNVIRGLHFQWDPPMGKLMWVASGTAFLVAVDIRHDSPTQGQWFGRVFAAEERKQLWAPPGCARGFCVLSEVAEIQYLCTGIYNPQGESGILWNDPDISIEWPTNDPLLSAKDRSAQSFSEWRLRAESKSLRS